MLIGFVVAAPVGPIGLLCIQRTLHGGRAKGLASGLGAATADGLYGMIAALGVTVLADSLLGHQVWLGVVGGALLCYMGIRAFRSRPRLEGLPTDSEGLVRAYLSTLVLTLTNPLTVLSFGALLSGLGITRAGGPLAAVQSGAGVFCGSALWWLLLTGATSVLRRRLPPQWLHGVNRLAGMLIAGMGLLLLARAVR